MTDADLNQIYQNVLEKVLNNSVVLPSMPDITMRVRQAVADERTTAESLTEILAKDPALTAYLVQAASSPVYRRAVPAKTLSEVTSLLGFSAISSLVMLHSTRHMVDLKSAESKTLFNHTWERLVVKTSIASFLSKKLKFFPVERVQMAMLLTEVGSLSVLSNMLSVTDKPDAQTYFAMCRLYSKKIGCEILNKWGVDPSISNMLARCGHWDSTDSESEIGLLDIANLALYYTVKMTTDSQDLPDVTSLTAFEKLPEALKDCSKENYLSLITDNDSEIQLIVQSFK